MISWLLIILLSYFFFSLTSLGDKLILAGKPKASSYTFFVGISGASVLLFLPFIEFVSLSQTTITLIIIEAFIFVLSLYIMYSALEKYEVSKVATTMGAAQPIIIFLLGWLVWGKEALNISYFLPFAFLLGGTIIISLEKNYKATGKYLAITLFASLLFSADYIITKIIFSEQSFLLGLFWMRITAFFIVLLFLLVKKNRQEFFDRKKIINTKNTSLFAFTNVSGGIANFLQAFAISLTPVAFLPILNSLRGVQYIFIFLITLFFSFFLPKILKEKISRNIIVKKIFAIILIIIGLALLT